MVDTLAVSSCATISLAASAGDSINSTIGASIPASRSRTPSSTRATPSLVAPASSAARATSTSPWPYAFALTTASASTVGATCERSARTLSRIAPRSTSA
jgi:hypothetical protein